MSSSGWSNRCFAASPYPGGAGIVKTQRDGKFIYYIIHHDRLGEIMKCVDELID